MRSIFLILIVVCSFSNTYSQSKIQGRFRTGATIQRDGILLEEDVCTFSLSDGSLCGRWVLQLDSKAGAYNIKEQDGYYGSFSFSIKELNIQDLKSDIEYGLKHYVFENDSSVYFKGNIISQDIAGNVIDCFPIRLNLLPSMPVLKNATLECDGFDWELYQFNNPILNIYFTSSRERKCIIKWGEKGYPYISTSFYYPYEKVGINADVKKMFFDDTIFGWDDYYILKAENDYGFVTSQDTIWMYKCVNDPELLKEYEKWLELITSIDVQSEDVIDVYYDTIERTLCFKGLLGLKEIMILKLDGTIIKQLHTDTQSVYIPEFKKGIYIVHVTANKRAITRKFLIN